MLKPLALLAGPIAALALAGPAAAQQPAPDTSIAPGPVCTGTVESDPGACTSGDAASGTPDQTVGQPQVITDPAAQVDGTIDGALPPRGEQHVLNAQRSSSSKPAVRRGGHRASPVTSTASDPATASTPAAAGAKTLPFTGVNAGYLALAGLLLLGAGLGVRRSALSVRP